MKKQKETYEQKIQELQKQLCRNVSKHTILFKKIHEQNELMIEFKKHIGTKNKKIERQFQKNINFSKSEFLKTEKLISKKLKLECQKLKSYEKKLEKKLEKEKKTIKNLESKIKFMKNKKENIELEKTINKQDNLISNTFLFFLVQYIYSTKTS